MPVWIGIIVAFVATSMLNFGLALQKRGAAKLPKLGKEKGATRALLTNRIWLVGLTTMVAGWGLYLYSTKIAPISIVQPALGMGLVVLAGFSVFYLDERIKPIEWGAFGAMIAGILFLGFSARGEAPTDLPEWHPLLLITAVILGLAVLAYVLGKRGSLGGIRTDSLLGIVSGLFIGLAALYTRSMFLFSDGGYKTIAFFVCLPVLIGANVMGLAIMQSGFQHGKALVVVALEAVINKVVAIIGGMLALGEYLPDDPKMAGMRIAAFVLILLGSAGLARFGGEEVAEMIEEGQKETG